MPNSIPTADRRARTESLIGQVEASGLATLSADDRGLLASVALADPRSTRLLPLDLDDASARLELCKAIRAAWLAEEWHIVLDYRRRLQDAIAKVRDPEYPIAELILYATWFEHTLNGILIRQGLLRGLDAAQAEAMVRDAKFDSKIGWLLTVLGLPELDPVHRGRLVRLMDARNQYVHYKWRGYREAAHEAQLRDLRSAVDDLEPTMGYLVTYYDEHLVECHVRNALATFRITREILAQNA